MGGTAGCGVQAAMAIDIREDRVKMGIVSREGNVLFSRRYPWETSSVAGFLDALVLDIADFQRQAEGRWEYDRVGVSMGGWIDREAGMWLYTAKVHGFADPVPLRYLIERATRLSSTMTSTSARLRKTVSGLARSIRTLHITTSEGASRSAL